MHARPALLLSVSGLLALASHLPALTVEEFQALPDQRPAIRQSFGVRSARAVSAEEIEVQIGMSVTDAAGNPAAYRIFSETDTNYPFAAFISPRSAQLTRTTEVASVKGTSSPAFTRTTVRLTLPRPLQAGTVYHVIAQGAGQVMVTAARTAAEITWPAPTATAALEEEVAAAAIGLRGLNPLGQGLLQVNFGPGLAPGEARTLSHYRVTINGQPAVVKNIGRISRLDTYLPVGWPFGAIPQHEVFLEIEPAYRQGDLIALEVNPALTAGRRTARLAFDESRSISTALKVNQVGYLPDSPVKIAYLGRWMGSFPEQVSAGTAAGSAQDAFWQALATGDAAAPAEISPALKFPTPPAFQVCEEDSGKVVYTATSRLVHTSGQMNEGVGAVDHSGENVYQLDFTACTTPGRYYLRVPGVGRSLPFRIDADVYAEAFRVQGAGMFIQRCGLALGPPHTPWHRIACHHTGVIPTTLLRSAGEQAAFKSLPEHVDYSSVEKAPPPAELQTLDRDPTLLAYWPLNGDLRDASGHGRDLTARGTAFAFEPVREVMPGRNFALGPTQTGPDNGAVAPALPLDRTNGFTFSLWVRFDGGSKFEGTLIGHAVTDINRPRAQLIASWGVLRGFVGARGEAADLGRLSDGKWHHIALVAGADRGLQLYLDGAPTGAGTLGASALSAEEFQVGALGGEEAAGKYIDEVRVYGRPLELAEVRTLSRRWGELSLAIPAYGGHHDAGDYNPRSHLDVAQTLMNAYEIAPAKFTDGQLAMPEQNNGLPDILDEAFWALRLWLDLQDADGGVRGGTESNGDPNFIQTVELDRLGDYAFAKDAGASFEFAGAFAQASRIWRSAGRTQEADDFLARARKAYAWAQAHPPAASSPENFAGYFLSPKAYAAAELLHTTGEATFGEDFRSACVWSKKPEADVDVYRLYDQQAAAWAYARCPANAVDPDLQQRVRAAIVRKADVFIEHSSKMAYGFIRHPWAPMTWGTAAYENWLDPLLWAEALTGDPTYRAWIIRTCDNTLGANPLGLSYITGLGTRAIRAPLHNSRYGASGEVVIGLQGQGPNQRGEGYRVAETAYPGLREDFAPLYTFVDAHFALSMNEGLSRSMAKSMAVFGLLQPDQK